MASSSNNRIVVLIDMDCFFCQVETKLQPEYNGKPLAVVQYNQWQLGGIIAVNYEAREYGVTRHMRGEEAKEKCPDLILASVPCLRGKSDTSRYRSAGRDVIDVLRKHCNIIERASVDEAYLDITDIVDKRMSTNSITTEDLITHLCNTFVVGYSEIGKNDEEERSEGTKSWISNVFEEVEDVNAQKLAVAGAIVEELRSDIFAKTGYKCSAGIAQNKILAKLACGLHKPNRQTILPPSTVSTLYSTLPIKKVRNLGGKFGDVIVESLNCNVMGDLLQYSLQYLQKRFDEKTGSWLYNIARGIDNEPVTMRLVSKSIGACKKFPGKQAITSIDVLKHWAGELSAEVCERLEQDHEENERRATLLTICYQYYQNKTTVSQSRSCTLTSYKPEKMADRCVEIVSKCTHCPIAYLGVSAGKFVQAKGRETFMNFFKPGKSEHREKTCGQMEVSKMECIQLSNNNSATKMDNININKIITSNVNDCETTNTSKSKVKNVKKGSINNSKLNERMTDMKTDSSPTSRRLNNLIESLNERNKRKTLYERQQGNSNVNESLGQSEFKESFFMNILNPKEGTSKDTCVVKTALIKLNDDKDSNINCDNLNENRIQEDGSEKNYVLGRAILINDRNTDFKTHDLIEREQPSSSIYTREDSKGIVTQCTTRTKLQDIFPNLGDIDPGILALLPMELQEEAKLYLKPQRKETTKDTLLKNSKVKSKSKTNTSKGQQSKGIYTFLVKRDSSNTADFPSKQCLQCYQMIPLSKYTEHCDFHVAENLQRELNNPILETASIKRKVDTCDQNTNCLKRRPNINVKKSKKKL
ncbi:PREDICTED: DNA polymerase eta [Dufourea novaeangliae]|uniref:DNA polymerase eta n=1 Tax=Dufourea novaeangliae TaxID=178035 RepID=UPI0007679567|nr:PREDICTED: DNA polymerase eta [Dufourea novaeangliae]